MNKNTALAGADTPGHHLLEAPSFPEGSIKQDGSGAWRCRNLDFAHYRSDDGGTYVGLRATQRIWQDVELPVGAPADEERADCVLGCRYNASWFDECTLSVYQLEGDQEQAELYRKPMRGDPPGPQAPTLADPTWHELTPDAVAIPSGVKRIRVALETPSTPQAALLYVRDVRLTWRLPAFDSAGEIRLIVDPQGANIQQVAPPFTLCHGATHRLEVKASAGDTWDGQKASLLWRSEGVGLPVEYGVEADPVLNIDDSDQEDRYQVLSNAAPASWQLTADSDPQVLSGALPVGLGSYWHAPLHGLDLSIGDGRYEVVKAAWDGVVPIVGEQNSTVLTATLGNPFVPARLPQGREVAWLLDGREYQRTITDADGEAKLVYAPKAGEQGPDNRVEFTVACVDELGQHSQQVLGFPVFEKAPWLEELEVWFDGKPVSELDEAALHLKMAGSHTLMLKPRRADNYFDGKPIKLQWPDGSAAQLGVSFTPVSEQTMTSQGISWTLQGGDSRGRFDLALVQARLAMPLTLHGTQMSANLREETELLLDGQPIEHESSPWFRRNTQHQLQIVPKDGELWAGRWPAAWITFEEGSLDEASLKAVPNYGTRRVLNDDGLGWSLTGGALSGKFGLQVHVEGFAQTWQLSDSMLVSLNISDEYKLSTVSGDPPVCLTGQVDIRITPTEGSPLPNKIPGAQLHRGLPADVPVVALPIFGAENPLAYWLVNTADQTGVFAVSVSVPGFTEHLGVTAVAVRRNLNSDGWFTFDGARVAPGQPLTFIRGRRHQIGIVLNPSSKLGLARLRTSLSSWPSVGVSMVPGDSVQRELTAQGMTWDVTATGNDFSLRFHLPPMNDLPDFPVTVRTASINI
ncbi:hypothetical protein [Pseudomonas sp. NPDC089406]|uniref:hypothetical protein n=1 Tax=Pseudomonas sp. NPDC089406 TaxID=3364463 RepID=UPI00384F552D